MLGSKSAIGQTALGLVAFLWLLVGCHQKQSISDNETKVVADTTTYSYLQDPLVIKADSFQNIGAVDSANWYYRTAGNKFLLEEQWELGVHCYNSLVFNLLELEHLDSARALTVRTKNVAENHLAKQHPTWAGLHFIRGLYFSKTGNVDSALFHYFGAVKIFERYDSPEFFIQKAHNYHRLGDVYMYALSNYPKAEKYYGEALRLREQAYSSIHFDLLVSYYALSSLSRLKSDFKRATIFGVNALQIAEQFETDRYYNMSLCYNLLGNIKYEEGEASKDIYDFRSSLDYYDKAIRAFENSSKKTENGISVYYNNMGAALILMNQFDSANAFFHKSLQLKIKEQVSDLSDSYLNLGWGHKSMGNLDSAKYYYNKCLQYRTDYLTNQISDLGAVYLDMGEMYESFDSLDLSIKFYQQAIDLFVPNFDLKQGSHYRSMDSIQDVQLAFKALTRTAGILTKRFEINQQLGTLKDALELYQFADLVNDENRNSSIHDESKLFLSNYAQADFERAIQACYTLNKLTDDPIYLDQAFQFIEKDKYVLLFESLSKAKLNNEIGVPDSILTQEQQLRSNLSKYELKHEIALKSGQPNQDSLQFFNVKMLEFNRRLEDLKERISTQYPGYYQVAYNNIARNIDSVQASLNTTGSMVVEYYWGTDALYVFAITRESTKLVKIDELKKVNSYIDAYLKCLASSQGLQEKQNSFVPFVEAAYGLYNILLEPLLNKNTSQLVIIPDDRLAQIPFESLLTKGGFTKMDYKNLPYLIIDYNIRYGFSSNLLLNSSQVNQQPSVLAFSHSDLAGSGKELAAIQATMEAKVFENEEATERNFKEFAPEYNLLHLAVHGEGSQESLLNSKLFFNKSEPFGEEDGELNVYELYGLNLNANLAILSACETGLGKQIGGEGMYSMARGFYYAGCSSLILSLWKINDQSSASIFKTFYDQLNKGISTDKALQIAKLNYLQKQDEISAHPSSWAALVLMGNTNWDANSKSQNGLLLSATLILIALGLIIFSRRYRAS